MTILIEITKIEMAIITGNIIMIIINIKIIIILKHCNIGMIMMI